MSADLERQQAKYLEVLSKGVSAWNDWREANPREFPTLAFVDFSDADLTGINLSAVDLGGSNFTNTRLTDALLMGANLVACTLVGADLTRAATHGVNFLDANLEGVCLRGNNLVGSHFPGSRLVRANLRDAHLIHASFNQADLTGADLRNADLRYTSFVNTNLSRANISGAKIYGVSAWDLNTSRAKQFDLIITDDGQSEITLDSIELAQFMHLITSNPKLREVIDTITSRVVLILGRFTKRRKITLNAIRSELRSMNYIPILFDFAAPSSRDVTEAVSTMAHMARFVIADITDARSIPQELAQIVPNLPSVPVQPILEAGSSEYGMFEHFRRYPWVLPIFVYPARERISPSLVASIVSAPATASRLGESRR
jgi:uncharacterized protein YjbI with pentapeptide repeats